jgi:hypothetical protein
LDFWTKLRQQYMAFLRRLKKPSGTGGGRKPTFRHDFSMGFLNDDVEDNEK